MSVELEPIVQMIFAAMDDVSKMQTGEDWEGKSLETHLTGPLGRLDSLGIVNLTVYLEESIEQAHGIAISLVEEAEKQDSNPFEKVGSLAGMIAALVDGRDESAQ